MDNHTGRVTGPGSPVRDTEDLTGPGSDALGPAVVLMLASGPVLGTIGGHVREINPDAVYWLSHIRRDRAGDWVDCRIYCFSRRRN